MCHHEDFPCCGCDDGRMSDEAAFEMEEAEANEYFDEMEDDGEEFDDCDESMDGDFDSAMASAGYGTDEDYGGYDGMDYDFGMEG